jgi:hypothetical protein
LIGNVTLRPAIPSWLAGGRIGARVEPALTEEITDVQDGYIWSCSPDPNCGGQRGRVGQHKYKATLVFHSAPRIPDLQDFVCP